MLALATIVAAFVFFRFAVMPVLGHVVDPTSSTSTLLSRCGAALSILLGYWLFCRFHEKRYVDELKLAPLWIALGVLSGAMLISLTTLSLFALGAYQVTEYRGWQITLPGVAGLIVVAAILEEVVFRGVVFRQLERALGTTSAITVTALVFGVVHLPNLSEDAGAMAILTTFVSVVLIGYFWTLLFAITRNLWFVTFHHAAWNFAIVLSGAPLSGVEEWRAAAPIASSDHGPAWLTGGIFGPEDSVMTIAIVAASIAIIFFWRTPRRKNAAHDPSNFSESLSGDLPVVALRDTASRLTELWSPRVVAAVDDYYVKICKVKGEFGWHKHASDELFIVLAGTMTIETRRSRVALTEGDCFVVRRGELHNPSALEECLLMLFEHNSTRHAGAMDAPMMPVRSLAEQLRPI